MIGIRRRLMTRGYDRCKADVDDAAYDEGGADDVRIKMLLMMVTLRLLIVLLNKHIMLVSVCG